MWGVNTGSIYPAFSSTKCIRITVDICPAAGKQFCVIFVQHFPFVHMRSYIWPLTAPRLGIPGVYSGMTGDSVLKEYLQ